MYTLFGTSAIWGKGVLGKGECSKHKGPETPYLRDSKVASGAASNGIGGRGAGDGV